MEVIGVCFRYKKNKTLLGNHNETNISNKLSTKIHLVTLFNVGPKWDLTPGALNKGPNLTGANIRHEHLTRPLLWGSGLDSEFRTTIFSTHIIMGNWKRWNDSDKIRTHDIPDTTQIPV